MSKTAFLWGAGLLAAAALFTGPLSERISDQEGSGSFHYLNSDIQYVPDLLRDISSGADLSGWTIPPANYFFPDLPVYGLFLGFLPGSEAALWSGLTLFFLNLLSLVIFLRCSRGSFLDAPYVFACGGLLVFALLLEYLPAQHFALILPTFHTTSIAGCLVFCSILTCSMGSRLRFAASFAAAFLFTFSDAVFLGLSAAALAAYLLVSYRNKLLPAALPAAGAWVLGAALARKTLDWIPLTVVRVRPEMDVLNLVRTQDFGAMLAADMGHWFYLVPAAAGSWLVFAAFSRSQFRQKLALPAAAAVACIAGASLFSRQVGLPSVEHRYAVYTVFFFVVAGVLAARHLSGRLTLFVLSLVMLAAAGHALQKPVIASPLLLRAACIDRLAESYRLKHGLADYWNAKSLTQASARVRINQVDAALGPRAWINNLSWYTDDSGDTLRYSFVIPARLHEDVILRRFGPPRITENCEGMTVWIYSVDGTEPLVPFTREQFSAWRAATGR